MGGFINKMMLGDRSFPIIGVSRRVVYSLMVCMGPENVPWYERLLGKGAGYDGA